jgi:hypothetical protein
VVERWETHEKDFTTKPQNHREKPFNHQCTRMHTNPDLATKLR